METMFMVKITFHPGNNTDWQGKKMRPHRFLFKETLKWIKYFIKGKPGPKKKSIQDLWNDVILIKSEVLKRVTLKN